MKHYIIIAVFAGFALIARAAPAARAEFGTEPHTGLAAAVKIGEVPLVHTATMLPRKGNEVVGGADIKRQAEQVLANLEIALALGGGTLSEAVKLNWSVAEAGQLAPVGRVLAQRFSAGRKPAITLVVSRQLHPGVLVSGDAVAVSSRADTGLPKRFRSKELFAEGRQSHAALLPAGPRIYLSGKGADAEIVAGTELTLTEAKQVMEYIHLAPKEIVQVKVMLKHLHDARKLETVLEKFFAPDNLPPVTFVERNSGRAAIEIEMIAVGKPGDARRPALVEYSAAPPHWPASPRFSHIARVNRGGSIYLSAAYGKPADSAEVQTRAIFSRLEELVRAAGGDFSHLAKAMYYVTNRAAVAALDKVRPQVFPADRPPAASRDFLRHVGGSGGALVVDLIAVPVEKK